MSFQYFIKRPQTHKKMLDNHFERIHIDEVLCSGRNKELIRSNINFAQKKKIRIFDD